MTDEVPEYIYLNAKAPWCDFLWPVIKTIVETNTFRERRAFDLGCGNGSNTKLLADLNFQVIGVDPSQSGIRVARMHFPHIEFHEGNAYDDLAGRYGRFSLVMSLEVIEHCYDPRKFARTLHELVDENGMAIVSTPYHGYLKNLALSVAGKWDDHLGPLWDGGHIKFFSIATLRALLEEAGFRDIHFIRVGRIPPLAKSMIAVARK
jgi:2-polyprenyl-3-methyl-5-hydroxy-6-metoxy-1,4-benzoquinol methylase